jgi:hypothetical protein
MLWWGSTKIAETTHDAEITGNLAMITHLEQGQPITLAGTSPQVETQNSHEVPLKFLLCKPNSILRSMFRKTTINFNLQLTSLSIIQPMCAYQKPSAAEWGLNGMSV